MKSVASSIGQVDEELARLVDDITGRLQAGGSIDLDDYAREYPDYADRLRDLVPALGALAGLGAAPAHEVSETTGQADDAGHNDAGHVDLAEEKTTVGKVPRLDELGDFRLLREIGRGGMGIVYEAQQRSLKRRVALKLLPLATILDSKQLARFQIEAQAAAGLHHTHIVTVYSVGCERGIHFYAMQYIDGQSLSEVIADLRRRCGESENTETQVDTESRRGLWPGPSGSARNHGGAEPSGGSAKPKRLAVDATVDTPETAASPVAAAHDTQPTAHSGTVPDYATRGYFHAVARLGQQVAEALHYAHGLGIVHRDIKPSNLLIDGQADVFLTDFGLAQVAGNDHLTMTGDLVGTLRYMSPEQASGDGCCVDCRCDVYSLGTTLYELVTLRAPFEGHDRAKILFRILREEPVPPRHLRPDVPRDLETIILKALRKDPAERYRSAGEMADDLRRFDEDRPIQARRPTLVHRARKWSRRNPWLVALSAAIAVVIMFSSVISNFMIRRAWRAESVAREAAVRERGQVQKQLALARSTNYDMQLGRVAEVWRTDSRRATQLLEDEKLCPPELREFTWHYFRQLCRRERLTLTGHDGPVRSAIGLPKHNLIVSAGADGTFRLWDLNSGAQRYVLQDHENMVSRVAATADEKRLASASFDGTVRLFRLEETDARMVLKQTQILRGHEGAVLDVIFSPDGKMMVSSGLDGTARVWNVAGDEQAMEIGADPQAVTMPRAAGSLEAEEVVSQHVLTIPIGEVNQPIVAVAFSPDGEYLAGSTDSAQVWIWETHGFGVVGQMEREKNGISRVLAFSSDGNLLATATARAIQLWDWRNATVKAELPGHHGHNIVGLAFEGDGRSLVSAGFDGYLRFWNLASKAQEAYLTGHRDRISSLSMIAEGGTLITACYDGTVKLWQLDSPMEQMSIGGHQGSVYSISFSPNGRLLASADQDASVRLFDAVSGQVVGRLGENEPSVGGVMFSPDGRTVATAGNDKTVSLWDVATLRELAVLRGHSERVGVLSFSPNGRTLATAGRDRTICLWDMETRTHIRTLTGHKDKIWALEFSRDGRWLVSAGRESTIRLWDAHTWRQTAVLEEPSGQGIGSCAISPDGEVLATTTSRLSEAGDHLGIIRLWDMSALTLRDTLRGHTDEVFSVAFSPDGETLASSSRDAVVLLWNVRTGQQRAQLVGHNDWVYTVAFSPDGQNLASAGGDGIKIWSGRTLPAAETAPPAGVEVNRDESFRTLAGHTESVETLDLCPRLGLFASGSKDGTVKMWDVASGEIRLDLEAHEERVTRVKFVPDGASILSSGWDGTVRLWNVSTGVMETEIRSLQNHAGADISADGKSIAVACEDDHTNWVSAGEVVLYEEPSLLKWSVTARCYGFPQWSSDGSLLAWQERTSHSTSRVVIHEAGSGKPECELPQYLGHINALAFVRGDRWLVVGSADHDRLLEVWDVSRPSRVHLLQGHTESVTSVAVSPDGEILASGSADHTIRLWDLKTGRPLKVLYGSRGGIYALVFTQDGRTLISGGGDHKIRFWSVPGASVLDTAVDLASEPEA